MTSHESEAAWAQAVDDGDYATAEEIREEEYQQRRRERAYYSVYVDPKSPFADEAVRESALRQERIFRAFGAASDPGHLLYPGPLHPRNMDCIDKRQIQPGEFDPW